MLESGKMMSAFTSARRQSAAWYERASRVLGGRVGHDARFLEPVPLYMARGAGGRKWDVDGNEYIDFLLGNGALLLGHAHPQVIEAIQQAAPLGTHFGNDHPLHIEWAELVQQLVPAAGKVRFVNSGTEASHLAIRLGRAHTGKSKIIRFHGHFHGWHDGVVHGFIPPFDAAGSLGVPAQVRDNTIALPPGDLSILEETLNRDQEIALVLIEPSGASWGRVPIDPEFLRGLRRLTRNHGVVLVFDEVVTGFRLAPGGAQEYYGVVPDLAIYAKVIAGGMPGGAVVGDDEIMALFDYTGDPDHDRFGRVVHYGTFNASPLSAAAGLATLKLVATGEPTRQADEVGERLRQAFDQVLESHGVAGYVYGISSTFHVYFETDAHAVKEAGSRRDLQTADPEKLKGMPGSLIDAYQRHIRHNGLDNMSSTGGVLSSMHTEDDQNDAAAAFERSIVGLLDEGQILAMS